MQGALRVLAWTLSFAALLLVLLLATYAPMIVRCTRAAEGWLAEVPTPLRSPPAALRDAMYAELKNGDPSHLVTRNLILTSGCSGWTRERGHEHIIDELVMMLPLRVWFSRDELLAMVMSRAFMGTKGGDQVYGFDNAAREFYGREIGKLDKAEFACLVRKMRAPNHSRYRCNGH